MTSARSSRYSTEHPSEPDRSPYRGRLIAVGTRHGKQHQFAPAFRAVLGADLITPPDLDTDQFGTFTGDVSRDGPAPAAARAKARLAMDITGLPYGLASEASYGPLPDGWHGHEELVLFRDDERGIEVIEGHRSLSTPGGRHLVAQAADLPDQLLGGLPGQALIVRSFGPDPILVKGITGTATLVAAIAAAAERAGGLAIVEPDLRAHHNPSRRRVLTRLGDVLAHRLATGCPVCRAPGFGRVDAEPGRPCRVCETPTALTANEIHACVACPHRSVRPVARRADPGSCPACNP